MPQSNTNPITKEDLTNALKPIFDRFDAIDKRFEAIDERFEAIDERFDTIETRLDAIDIRLHHIEQDIGRIDQNIQIIAGQGGYGYNVKRKRVPPREQKVG